jgi:hypothetical protein
MTIQTIPTTFSDEELLSFLSGNFLLDTQLLPHADYNIITSTHRG